MPAFDRIAGRAVVVAASVCALLTLGCLTWAAFQTFLRPPDYAEGCVLFNAARIRDGLPLYVDPSVGAHEYGEPPARYFVAYTPLLAAALSLFSAQHAIWVGRLGGLLAWYGALAMCVVTARAECRRNAAAAALFVAAILLFARWSVCVKPDAFALLIAATALARTLDRGRADAVSGALLALAAVLKPSVIGIAIGAVAASTFYVKERRWSAFAAAGAVGASVFAVLHVASGGLAIEHLRSALGLAFNADHMLANVLSRGPFVGGLVAAAIASARGDVAARGRIALASLSACVVIACIGFGKTGAASNYLMESALASVVVLSRLPLPPARFFATRLALVASFVVTFAWAANATVRSLADEARTLGSYQPALARIRERCMDRAGAFVASTDPGVELVLNGRIHTHHIELWNDVRLGRLPVEGWAADMRHPSVRCLVTWTGHSPPPPHPDVFLPPEVAAVVLERFVAPTVDGGYATYRAADP